MSAVLTVRNLGPIEKCVLEISNFTVLTGKQASGKSTIAKCVYFFRSIKDDIADEILRNIGLDWQSAGLGVLKRRLRRKFIEMFGEIDTRTELSSLKYEYSGKTFIEINIKYDEPEKIKFDIYFSNDIKMFISKKNIYFERSFLMKELDVLFSDDYQAIFIPAGRSSISLLSSQLNYIYATMDDSQKRTIDYCTQRYIELILKIRSLLSKSSYIKNLLYENFSSNKDLQSIGKIRDLMDNILNGTYAVINGEERLYLNDADNRESKYVKLNYSSSGQQETVWIFNILMYVLANRTKAFIILEEPEAHLYPDSQKIIAEILALASNMSCQMLVTTHSPYILGAVNNLIFADYLSKHTKQQVEIDKIIPTMCHIQELSAYYVDMGKIESCVEDSPEKLIINEIIDGASETINRDYDMLFDISQKDGDGSAV